MRSLRQRLRQAFADLTGRVFPAPWEAAYVIEVPEGEAVTIRQVDQAVIDCAWKEGWVTRQPPTFETGRSVAVIGVGLAAMAMAMWKNPRGVDLLRLVRYATQAG